MDWIVNLFTDTDSVAHIALLYAFVISFGVFLGKVKIGGIALGATFVLFVGILAGHVGFTAPADILSFIQDFGLILFVFMIGLQVGPGFFESLPQGRLQPQLDGHADDIPQRPGDVRVLLPVLRHKQPRQPAHDGGYHVRRRHQHPGLGAANEALQSVFPNGAPSIANGYACAYPLGVLGIIGTTILLKYICKVKLEDEEKKLDEAEAANPMRNHT